MKKFLVLAMLATSAPGLFAAGEGFAFFSGPSRGVWDNFHQPFGRSGPGFDTENVSFLWGTGTPLISTVASAVPTNAAPGFSFSISTAWDSILNDPAFHLATNANYGSNVIAPVLLSGGWNAGGSFPILGTTPGNYKVYVIGWDDQFATPQLAAAAGAAVGWSAPFTYTTVIEPQIPSTFAQSGFVPFGVIPEPGALSLIGLGAGAWLIGRREELTGRDKITTQSLG